MQRILNNGTPFWNYFGNSSPVSVCDGNADAKYPDITRTGNYPVFTHGYAMIVWQDWRSSCGGTTNNFVQMVDYELAAVYACQWSANGLSLSISGGVQNKPQIQKSAGNSAAIFWNDDATGVDCTIGARMMGDYAELGKRTIAVNRSRSNNLPGYATRNYPNPFSSSTTIAFKTDEVRHVRLEIFDRLGRIIATLLDANLASGNYEIPYNGSGAREQLRPGVYYYRLWLDDRVSTHAMVRVQ